MSEETHDTVKNTQLRGFILLRGLILPVPHNRSFILGRDKNSCNIALPDQRISKQHLSIVFRESKYVITDLDSVNGTFLNGEKVDGSLTLMPGDEIKITPFSMMFIGPDQLNRPQNNTSPPDEKSHFRGELETLKALDLIQLINTTGQSGLLTIRDSRNKQAQLTFIDGEIRQARAGSANGENAVFAILNIEQGKFDFVRGKQEPGSTPIQKRTQNLLFEGCQLKDENRIPDPYSSGERSSRKSTQPLAMDTIFSPSNKS